MRSFFVVGFLFFFSCNSVTKKICGEPEGVEKALMDSINVKYQGILIGHPVPCYFTYYQINLITDLDSLTLNSLEVLLREKGYTEVLIYNKNNELIRGNVGSM